MQISAHFTLEELTVSEYAARHDLGNSPPPSVLDNLREAAAGMEAVRSALKSQPIHVTSGYRSPLVNAGVGGAPSSAHCNGYAVDFICPGFGSNYLVAQAIAKASIRFDQLILEYGWVHVSFAPTLRCECLTKKSASAPYEHGLIP